MGVSCSSCLCLSFSEFFIQNCPFVNMRKPTRVNLRAKRENNEKNVPYIYILKHIQYHPFYSPSVIVKIGIYRSSSIAGNLYFFISFFSNHLNTIMGNKNNNPQYAKVSRSRNCTDGLKLGRRKRGIIGRENRMKSPLRIMVIAVVEDSWWTNKINVEDSFNFIKIYLFKSIRTLLLFKFETKWDSIVVVASHGQEPYFANGKPNIPVLVFNKITLHGEKLNKLLLYLSKRTKVISLQYCYSLCDLFVAYYTKLFAKTSTKVTISGWKHPLLSNPNVVQQWISRGMLPYDKTLLKIGVYRKNLVILKLP